MEPCHIFYRAPWRRGCLLAVAYTHWVVSSRTSDPRRLDVAAAAVASLELAGDWPLAGFARLATATLPASYGLPGLHWHIRGERALLAGAGVQASLRIGADTEVTLECQRCLQPMPFPIRIERRIFFVDGEDAAAALDVDSEDDVLAIAPALDLHALLEDEMLLALPVVPRHEVCAQPLPQGTEPELPAEAVREHPFAALAALKGRNRPS